MSELKQIYFCPNCHFKNRTPRVLLSVKVGGSININCCNCNNDGKNSKGVIRLKGKESEK